VHRRAVEPCARAAGREQLRRERLGRHQEQPHPFERGGRAEGRRQLGGARDGREAAEQRVAPCAEVVEIRLHEVGPGRPVARRGGVE
jgi:hypothetical protein